MDTTGYTIGGRDGPIYGVLILNLFIKIFRTILLVGTIRRVK